MQVTRTLGVLSVVFVVAAHAWSQPAPVQLGSQRHMFIDDMMVAEMKGVSFAVRPPDRPKVVLDFENDWENPGEYSSVIADDKGYRMYYLSTREGAAFVCLATSTDGVKWEKPKLGLHEYRGSKENNIVIWGTGSGSAYYDEHDPDPNRRYKYFTCQIGDDRPGTKTAEGMVVYNSPDGVHFTKLEVTLLPFNADSQAIMFWDHYHSKYVCYMRGNDGDIPNSRGRKVVRGETDDPFKPWPYQKIPNPYMHGHEIPYVTTELPTVLASDKGDPIETDIYGSQVFLYPWAHRVYLAFPTVYYHYKNDRVHLTPDGKGGNVGAGEVQLAVSRDGIKWTRYRRPSYVKQGWFGDSYCSWPWALRGLLRRDNRIYQYINYRRSGHGGTPFVESITRELDGFSLVKIPADRFVAAEFDYTGGTLTTEPFIFSGDSLSLNLDTSGVGEARVGILKADKSSIDGFKVSECDLMNGDYLDRKVTWKKKSDVSSLAGQPVRLQFEMRGTKLYAFQFVR
jgi:hypothetical protein